MRKIVCIFAVLLCFGVGGIILSKTTQSATKDSPELINILDSDSNSNDVQTEADSDQYYKYTSVPATEQMPALNFELIGKSEVDDYNLSNPRKLYYPLKLFVKTGKTIIQEIDFNEDDFAPCTLDTFDFEYGDFKFDGYGGFKILSTSMGKNPSYYFWIWDIDKNCFVKYPDLEMVGYITFDYDSQLINVFNSGGGDYHDFTTYMYIDDKLTLIEKVVDADYDGYRKVYKLINGELELIETTESHLRG